MAQPEIQLTRFGGVFFACYLDTHRKHRKPIYVAFLSRYCFTWPRLFYVTILVALIISNRINDLTKSHIDKRYCAHIEQRYETVLTLIFMLQSGIVFIHFFILRHNQEIVGSSDGRCSKTISSTKLNEINELQPPHNLRKTDIFALVFKNVKTYVVVFS